jgi:hypothetical protein
MKRAVLLAFASILGADCASHNISRATQVANLNQNTQQTLAGAGTAANANVNAVSEGSEKTGEAPVEFGNIDFKNFTYPVKWGKGSIRLTDGKYEHEDCKDTGGDTFELRSVDYVDLTGDEQKEAIVQVGWVSCGVSCDGGSNLFYLYSVRNNRLTLLWRLETGSLGYGCGLRSFIVRQRIITLEVFNKCRFDGSSFERENYSDETGKFAAKAVTRLIFKFNGKRFVREKREVFTSPGGDAKNYHAEVSISDD